MDRRKNNNGTMKIFKLFDKKWPEPLGNNNTLKVYFWVSAVGFVYLVSYTMLGLYQATFYLHWTEFFSPISTFISSHIIGIKTAVNEINKQGNHGRAIYLENVFSFTFVYVFISFLINLLNFPTIKKMVREYLQRPINPTLLWVFLISVVGLFYFFYILFFSENFIFPFGKEANFVKLVVFCTGLIFLMQMAFVGLCILIGMALSKPRFR